MCHLFTDKILNKIIFRTKETSLIILAGTKLCTIGAIIAIIGIKIAPLVGILIGAVIILVIIIVGNVKNQIIWHVIVPCQVTGITVDLLLATDAMASTIFQERVNPI